MSDDALTQRQRGLLIICLVLFLSTVGVFCLIVTLIIVKNKVQRRRREKRLEREKSVRSRWYAAGAQSGGYARLGDGEEGMVR